MNPRLENASLIIVFISLKRMRAQQVYLIRTKYWFGHLQALFIQLELQLELQ